MGVWLRGGSAGGVVPAYRGCLLHPRSICGGFLEVLFVVRAVLQEVRTAFVQQREGVPCFFEARSWVRGATGS